MEGSYLSMKMTWKWKKKWKLEKNKQKEEWREAQTEYGDYHG